MARYILLTFFAILKKKHHDAVTDKDTLGGLVWSGLNKLFLFIITLSHVIKQLLHLFSCMEYEN